MAYYIQEQVLLTSLREKSHRGFEFLYLRHPSSLQCHLQKRGSKAEIRDFYLAPFILIEKKIYLSRNIFLNDEILVTSQHNMVYIFSMNLIIKVDI